MNNQKKLSERNEKLDVNKVREIDDDILLDVAGGLKTYDALEKWSRFSEKFPNK